VNPEVTQICALAASGGARKKAAEISNKSVAAWGDDPANLHNLSKGLRMGGAVLSRFGYESWPKNDSGELYPDSWSMVLQKKKL
jgi:hypothetical protein